MKIAWSTYKVVFIALVVVYGTFSFLHSTGTLDQESSSAERPILVFLFGQIFLFVLFCFFLYAKTKGVEDCHKLLNPSRWLPFVTFLVVLGSVKYSVTFIPIVCVLESKKAEFKPVLESRLKQMKKDALDIGVPIEKRREKADRYHRETNETTPFLDAKGARRFLEPTEASKAYDKEFQEIQDAVDTLYRVIGLSGLASFLSSATAIFFYVRNR